ncbi:hypothetical protein VTI74DRAFT_6271 [Chaetomium olivicolor]
MLGLWSMAGQRAGHCRACLRVTRTAQATARTTTRRAAGATSEPGRQKVQPSDAFTACYTAIMATAAAVDAGRKHHRRRELDRRIAEAKSDLARMLEESNSQDLAAILESPYPDVSCTHQPRELDILDDLCQLQRPELEKLAVQTQARSRMLRDLRARIGIKLDPEIHWQSPLTLHQCEEIMAKEDRDPDQAHREPRNDEEFTKMTEMITDLVDRLMAEAYWETELEAPGTHPSYNSPDSASTMIRMLRSDGYPNYSHAHVNPAEAVEHRARLNEVNTRILSGWAAPFRERLVAKICYNFLVCPVPPNMQNYNALILGFSLLGEHALAQAVVDSFLHLSCMKPTEATYLCLIHHYRLRKDLVGFHSILRRCFGHDARGIGLTRRTADSVARDPNLQAWARTADVALVNNHYVVERAPLTQNVAEALMEALIDFHQLRDAAKLLILQLQQGWTLNHDLARRLFGACLTLIDTEAIKVIIRGLLDHIDKASSLLLGPQGLGPKLVRQLRYMLNIWQVTTVHIPDRSYDDEPSFSSSPAEPDHAVIKRREENLNHLVRAIWIRETYHHSSMMCWWMRRARRRLDDVDVPLEDRLDHARVVIDIAANRPVRKLDKTRQMQRIAGMAWLITSMVRTENMISYGVRAITDYLAMGVPRKLRSPAWRDGDIPLEKRIRRVLPYLTPGTRAYEYAQCFRRAQAIEWEFEDAVFEALEDAHAVKLEEMRNDTGNIQFQAIVHFLHEYLSNFEARHAHDYWATAAKATTDDTQMAKDADTERERSSDPFVKLLEAIPKPSFLKRKRRLPRGAVGEQGW